MEKWININDYIDKYQISSFGRVKSLERYVEFKNGTRFIEERILKPSEMSGYNYVVLCKNGKMETFSIHRLVAIHFLNKKGLFCVNHKNGIKTDNNVNNLEWVTASYNSKHSYDNKLTSNYGENCGLSSISKITIENIIFLLKNSKLNFNVIASQNKVSVGTIYGINNGKTRVHEFNEKYPIRKKETFKLKCLEINKR